VSTVNNLLAVILIVFTSIFQAQATTMPPTKLTAKQRVSPLIARLTYLWAGEISDAAGGARNAEQAIDAMNQIDAIRRQIDQSIQFDFRTVGDLIILHMIDNGAFQMDNVLLHRGDHSPINLDEGINPFSCITHVQDGAKSHSISMMDTTPCGTAQ
jgi:hypothetical protein